jgi:hypothetical protein
LYTNAHYSPYKKFYYSPIAAFTEKINNQSSLAHIYALDAHVVQMADEIVGVIALFGQTLAGSEYVDWLWRRPSAHISCPFSEAAVTYMLESQFILAGYSTRREVVCGVDRFLIHPKKKPKSPTSLPRTGLDSAAAAALTWWSARVTSRFS